MPTLTPRRYTEDEMRAVFAHAARATPPVPPPEGFTLEELQQIGASAGLDPAQIEAAAASLERPGEAGRIRWGIRSVVRTRRVVGAEFSDAAWEEAVPYLREAFGGPGTSGQTGRTREWASPGPFSGGTKPQVYVTVRPLGETGMTEVTMDYPSAQQGAGLVGALSGLFVMLAVLQPVLLGLVSGKWGEALLVATGLMAVAALMFVFVRAAVVRQQQTVAASFDAAIDRLDLIARRAAPPMTAPTAAPLLHLDGAAPDVAPDVASAEEEALSVAPARSAQRTSARG